MKRAIESILAVSMLWSLSSVPVPAHATPKAAENTKQQSPQAADKNAPKGNATTSAPAKQQPAQARKEQKGSAKDEAVGSKSPKGRAATQSALRKEEPTRTKGRSEDGAQVKPRPPAAKQKAPVGSADKGLGKGKQDEPSAKQAGPKEAEEQRSDAPVKSAQHPP